MGLQEDLDLEEARLCKDIWIFSVFDERQASSLWYSKALAMNILVSDGVINLNIAVGSVTRSCHILLIAQVTSFQHNHQAGGK